ncbi:transporter [Plantactinospora sp. S1510]|uniref:Transporter n=1 Tax=Plantactinospora alkalitolerans TaxID=2789879 RepID=A0ABS0GRB1_9ACTN|nr:transporter [Plantactinospora alkalitolerans]MBF9128594.1 transporter [Plantactinospora alkalitolerans]
MTGNFDHEPADDHDELPPADPAAALRLIAEQQAEAARQLSPNLLWYYWPWGLAWLIGFGLLFLHLGPNGRVFVDMPLWLPLTTLFTLLIGAGIISGITGARTYGQITGDSRRRGKWYGLAWGLGFSGVMAVLGPVSEHLPEDLAGLLWAGVSVGLTGALHMAGGAIWLDRSLFRLGVWISVINIVGVIAGPGWHALVISLAGGGGMLVAGVVFLLRDRARGATLARSTRSTRSTRSNR